jgi:hypothetical protein
MAAIFTWHNNLLPSWNRTPSPVLTSTNTKLYAQNILTVLSTICGTNSDYSRKGICCLFCNGGMGTWDWTIWELCCCRLNSSDTWRCVFRLGVLYVWQDGGTFFMEKQSKLYPEEGRIRFLEMWGTIQPLTLRHMPEDLQRMSLFCALWEMTFMYLCQFNFAGMSSVLCLVSWKTFCMGAKLELGRS